MSFTTPFGGGGADLGNRMFEEFKTVSGPTKKFLQLIVHVPRTENIRADSLACSARKQSSSVVRMDAELPVWFTESS
ncbi:hypothetical protein Bca4012_088890 [Brassica carinata]